MTMTIPDMAARLVNARSSHLDDTERARRIAAVSDVIFYLGIARDITLTGLTPPDETPSVDVVLHVADLLTNYDAKYNGEFLFGEGGPPPTPAPPSTGKVH